MATLEVYDLDQSTAMAVMMDGLLKNDLKKLLTKTYPWNFSDMLAYAKRYARWRRLLQKKPLPVLEWQVGTKSYLQGGRGEPTNTLGSHSTGRKMGA